MAQLTGLFTLGRDAELRTTGGGDQVATLALAYNYGRKGEDGRQPTQWVEAALWGERAAKLAEHLTKAKQISAVVADLRVETFDKRDGGQGVKLVGRVMDLEFARGPRQEGAASTPAARPAPAPRPAQAPAPAVNRAPSGFDDIDDDIPF